MHTATRLAAFCTLPLGLLVSWSWQEAAPVTEAEGPIPADLAKLVPDDATFLVQFDSLDALDEVDEAFSSHFPDWSSFRELLASGYLPESGMDSIDPSRPLALTGDPTQAMMGGSPLGAWILPVADGAGFVASLTESETLAPAQLEGNYVSVPQSPAYARGTGTTWLTKDLLPGDVSMRLDLMTIIENLRPLIETGLESIATMASSPMMQSQAGGMDMEGIVDLYLEWAEIFMDSAEGLDAALDTGGSMLDIDMALHLAEGSDMSFVGSGTTADLLPLAGYMGSDSFYEGLVAYDPAQYVALFEPVIGELLANYPEEFQTLTAFFFEEFAQWSLYTTGAIATNMDFSPTGVRSTNYLACKDAGVVMDRISALPTLFPENQLGIEWRALESVSIGGLELKRIKVDIDYDQLAEGIGGSDSDLNTAVSEMMRQAYGEDGLTLGFVAANDTVMFVIGGDEKYLEQAVTQFAAGPRQPSKKIKDAIDSLPPGSMKMVLEMDLAEYMRQMSSSLGDMESSGDFDFAERLEGTSADVFMTASIDELAWRGSLRVDLEQMGELFEMLSEPQLSTDYLDDLESPDQPDEL